MVELGAVAETIETVSEEVNDTRELPNDTDKAYEDISDDELDEYYKEPFAKNEKDAEINLKYDSSVIFIQVAKQVDFLCEKAINKGTESEIKSLCESISKEAYSDSQDEYISGFCEYMKNRNAVADSSNSPYSKGIVDAQKYDSLIGLEDQRCYNIEKQKGLSDKGIFDSESPNNSQNKEISTNIELDLNKIRNKIGTKEGIKNLIENHSEKLKSLKKNLDIISDCNATPQETNHAETVLKSLKGTLLEEAVKDILAEAGFDVEVNQRQVEGENGITKPDIIAKNNTTEPISIFNGITIEPNGIISIECKCGKKDYIELQLKEHIPNQLSGQQGQRVLLVTKDGNMINSQLNEVCNKYNAKLVIIDVDAETVDNALKEAAKS